MRSFWRRSVDHHVGSDAFSRGHGRRARPSRPHVRTAPGLGPHHAHLGAAGVVRAWMLERATRVQHIAHDGHADGEVPEADGVGIEQARVGWAWRPSPALTTCMGGQTLRNQVGRTALAVAHHENVGGHGRQVGNGVEQAFARLEAEAAGDVEVEHIGAQAGWRQSRRWCGCGCCFQKQVEPRFAAQQGTFFPVAVAHRHEVAGGVQDVSEDVFGQPLGGQQVNQLAVLLSWGLRWIFSWRIQSGLGVNRRNAKEVRLGAGRPPAGWSCPSSRRASASFWLAGRLRRAAARGGPTAARARPGSPARPGSRWQGDRSRTVH